jgi:putative oxidoreductase
MKNLFFPAFYQGRTAWGLLALRLVFGTAFILHGYGKIQHAFNWMGETAPVPGIIQAAAAFSEFGGGFAILLGLLTPLAALGLVGTMTGALLMVHFPAGHSFVAMSDPTEHTYELALVYWTIALTLGLTGPGTYSVDALLFNRKKPSPVEQPTLVAL